MWLGLSQVATTHSLSKTINGLGGRVPTRAAADGFCATNQAGELMSVSPKRKKNAQRLFGLIVLALAQLSFAAGNSQTAQDMGWPRQTTKNGSALIYYQPQIAEWKD